MFPGLCSHGRSNARAVTRIPIQLPCGFVASPGRSPVPAFGLTEAAGDVVVGWLVALLDEGAVVEVDEAPDVGLVGVLEVEGFVDVDVGVAEVGVDGAVVGEGAGHGSLTLPLYVIE